MIRISILLIAFIFSQGSQSCTINFGQLRNSEPIFLNTDFSFMIPQGNSINLQTGTTFLVDCGEGRRFDNTNIQQYTVQCLNGVFMAGNQQLPNVGSLECVESQKSPVVRVEKTSSICGDDGRIYNIGFHVQNGNSQAFLPVLQSCFDEQYKSVFYVKSHIFGMVNRMGSTSFSINNGRYTDGSIIQSSDFEVKSLKNAFSSNQFHRGHYAPNADYPFAQHRRSTFLYYNMGPMKPRFNGQDWGSLEAYIRTLIGTYKQTATVFTGGFAYNSQDALATGNRPINILNLDPSGQTLMMPGIQVKSIVVPDLFWKIVKIQNNGVAFFMFDDQTIQTQNFCTNLCAGQKYFCCNVDRFIAGTAGIKGNFNWPQEARASQTFNL